MAKNISLLGANYPDVPAVVLPKTGGGSAVFYDIDEIYPVGSVFVSTLATAPTFGGTWREIVMPATWGDLEDGTRSYLYGTGNGTVHFYKRTA